MQSRKLTSWPRSRAIRSILYGVSVSFKVLRMSWSSHLRNFGVMEMPGSFPSACFSKRNWSKTGLLALLLGNVDTLWYLALSITMMYLPVPNLSKLCNSFENHSWNLRSGIPELGHYSWIVKKIKHSPFSVDVVVIIVIGVLLGDRINLSCFGYHALQSTWQNYSPTMKQTIL